MSVNNQRYKRQITLPQIGHEGQLLLSNARVLVVGAGGLGCPALQYLAAAGIGCIEIIDFDTVSLGNLNRQILFNPTDVGQNKAKTAQKKLLAFNPEIEIIAHSTALNRENAKDLILACDVVLDCTDSPLTRYLINDVCVALNKPFVYAGIHRMEGQLAVFNFRYGATYRCVFPENINHAGASCEENGVLGTVPGVLGLMQAQEAIKILVMPDTVNINQLLVFNFLTNEITPVKTKRLTTENLGATKSIKDIDAQQLQDAILNGKEFTFIDVREEYEAAKPEEFEGISLPLSSWNAEQVIRLIPTNKPVIIFCEKGIRSEMAIHTIPAENRKNLLNLKGGLSAWKQLKAST
jgi:molybdopterin/thiamine biosynthesis adenylyltransferase/rhodanese-related sulfurtransferase